ncbi:MAG TPA: phenylacetic acid degradation protein PaaY [Syntrophomonas sp.]|jgi:carbonic anhydrase/acetyltransferase-like protein (isoleucine patch superfamily)|nr:phenylacetic acid degradation protein PaaY [Syntrophomonas sp.]HCF70584.1 phenylacetic acid degradation protein PaaY [Syntrophomonas sp.]
MFYEFEGKRPVVGKTSFIHPQAVIIGDVTIGEKCFIGAGAVLRGDFGQIVIGDGSNIQENSVIHSQSDEAAVIGDNVLIGHTSIVHGPCVIDDNAVIGMGAIVSVDCNIEAGGMLAAGSILPPGHTIPAHKLAVGAPARITKDIDEPTEAFNRVGIQLYQELAGRCLKGLKPIEGQ